MQSGIEDNKLLNNQSVSDLDNVIKSIEKLRNLSTDKKYAPNSSKVENVNYETGPENIKNNPTNVITPCLKTRKSLENLTESDNVIKKKNHQYKSLLKSKSQTSDPNLANSKLHGFSKILQWDPWHKIGRNKNKKNKHKTVENKTPITVTEHNTGDGPKTSNQETKNDQTSIKLNTYKYELKNADDNKEDNLDLKSQKTMKIVRFHADVKVVHYAGDEILGQTIEPLKKELEQQERNKELRKEFSPETGIGLKQSLKKSASDYMAAWYKR